MGEKLSRPAGLSLIAIFWFLGALYNLYISFQTITLYLDVLPYLSDPTLHEWFSFGVPVEFVLAILVLCLGILQIITIPGLWMGKPYSYKLALAIPILLFVANVSLIGLYASAPPELDLGFYSGNYLPLGMSLFWLAVYWIYLRQPNVKAFLGVTQSQSIVEEKPESIAKEKPIIPKEEKSPKDESKFYCRYCGAENKSDAVFCEKCGKNIQ